MAILSALAAGLLILGVRGADIFGFTPTAIWIARLATGCVILYAALRFVYFPLRRRISDVQVAQFIEERFPQLEDRLITAVEYGESAPRSGLIGLVTQDALDQSDRIDFSLFEDRRKVLSYCAVTALSTLALAGLVLWGPPVLPYGFGRLYLPWEGAAGTAAMRIEVTPGEREINRGSDQQILARLVGFDTREVALYTQAEKSTAWIRLAMEPQSREAAFFISWWMSSHHSATTSRPVA